MIEPLEADELMTAPEVLEESNTTHNPRVAVRSERRDPMARITTDASQWKCYSRRRRRAGASSSTVSSEIVVVDDDGKEEPYDPGKL